MHWSVNVNNPTVQPDVAHMINGNVLSFTPLNSCGYL